MTDGSEGDDAAPTRLSLPTVHGLTGLRVESFNVPGALFEVLSSDRILVVEYTQPDPSLHLVMLAATDAEVLDTLKRPVGLEVGAPQGSDSHVFATLYPIIDGAQRGSCDSSCGCSTVPVDSSWLAIITTSSDSLALRVCVLSSGRAEVLDVAGSSAIVRLENTQPLLRVDATDVDDPMVEVLDGVASLRTRAGLAMMRALAYEASRRAMIS